MGVFLTALREEKLIEKALIVVPGTLIEYWKGEILRWTPEKVNVKVKIIYGAKRQREKALASIKGQKVFAVISPESFR